MVLLGVWTLRKQLPILRGNPKNNLIVPWILDYVLTEPLTLGNHTVHFKSSLICSDPGCAEPNFAQDINYNIVAK